jgi:hypothetical protein
MATAKVAAGHTVRLAMLAATLTGTANAGSPEHASTHHHGRAVHAKQVQRRPQHSVRLSCDRRNSWLQNLLADKQCVDRAMADDGQPLRSSGLPVLYRAVSDPHAPFQSAGLLTPTRETLSAEIAL